MQNYKLIVMWNGRLETEVQDILVFWGELEVVKPILENVDLFCTL